MTEGRCSDYFWCQWGRVSPLFLLQTSFVCEGDVAVEPSGEQN
jgi:hypothetical protein